jgi:hypothetical protein
MYALATAELLDVSLDRPERALRTGLLQRESRFDTALFLDCMKILGIHDCLLRIAPLRLIVLKHSAECALFRAFYFRLIDVATGDAATVRQLLPVFRSAAQDPRSLILNKAEFLRSFEAVCGSIAGKVARFSDPLDAVRCAYDLLGASPLEAFIEKMASLTGWNRKGRRISNLKTMTKHERDHVFISYSHKDERWLQRLLTMLAPLIDTGAIRPWSDRNIAPGSEWKAEIERALQAAKVAVLLVSPDFFSSRFIVNNELPPLLDAAQRFGLTILWVAVRPAIYEATGIAKYQAANDPAKPLSGLTVAQREQAIKAVCQSIHAACNR